MVLSCMKIQVFSCRSAEHHDPGTEQSCSCYSLWTSTAVRLLNTAAPDSHIAAGSERVVIWVQSGAAHPAVPGSGPLGQCFGVGVRGHTQLMLTTLVTVM